MRITTRRRAATAWFPWPLVAEDLAEKSRARSERGLEKKSSGAASSTMEPSAMNTTRFAARRAKPISWVTTTIVMPSPASEVITASTSLTISGSRALVGSSNSITLGAMARDRAMATRCCWPPES